MRGTNSNGGLAVIPNCSVIIPGAKTITFNALPELSGAKNAVYNDEPIIGRATPLKTYSHSDNRAINLTFHFFVIEPADINARLSDMRALDSATYPRIDSSGAPFIPPPVCQLQFGRLLGDNPVCAVLKSYSVKWPTDVVWLEDNGIYLPMKFDVDTQWDAVYRSDQLPGQDRIFSIGA